jgi:hypothetical protein
VDQVAHRSAIVARNEVEQSHDRAAVVAAVSLQLN